MVLATTLMKDMVKNKVLSVKERDMIKTLKKADNEIHKISSSFFFHLRMIFHCGFAVFAFVVLSYISFFYRQHFILNHGFHKSSR